MTEKASLIIEVIENGVKKTTIDLKSLGTAAKEAEGRTNDLGKSFINTDSKAAQLGIRMTMLSKVAATYLSYEAVKKAMAIADSMQNIRTQVQLVTSSHEEAIRVQEELFNVATRTYSNLEATTTLYTRTARALKDAGKSQADFLKFTEAINNAMRLGGANATEQASALLQLSQALGSGVLQGDEFRSIAENAPILLDLVAKELGVVRGEVKALSAEGKITSEVIFNALTKSAGQLAQDASKVTVTTAAAMENLKTNLYTYADGMLNATGITSGFVNIISFLSNNIEFVFAPIVGGVAVYAVLKLRTALMTLTGAGGPIMIAIGVISMLASAWNHNSQEIEKMRGEIGLVTEDLLKMSKTQVEAHEVKLKIVLEDDKASLKDLENNLKAKEELVSDLEFSISQMYERQRNNRDNQTIQQYERERDALILLKEEYEALSSSIARRKAQLKGIAPILDEIEMRAFNRRLHDPGFSYSGENIDLGPMEKVNKILEDYKKKSDEAKIKTHEQAVTLLLQDDAYKDLNETLKTNYILRAAQIDTDNKAEKSAETVANMLKELADQAEKAGKNMREIVLIDLTKNGATKEQIDEAMAFLDKITTNTPPSGKSTIDHYNDRLQDMSRELSQVLSLNKELESTGYTSQYNAVSQITLELNDQASTLYKISDAQKQVLIGQAQQIDAANQLNAIMSLGTDYTKRIEDLEFENELMGKSAQQIEAMRFAYELESQAKLLSIGMSKENILVLEQEIQKQKERYGLAMQEKALKDDSYTEGIKKGFADYIDGVGTVREQTAGAITMTFGHLEDSLVGFAQNSKFSFSEMTTSILNDLSRILIRMGMMNMVTAGFGEDGTGGAIGGLFKKWGWFADGGYTGHGGVYEPAGVVHKGEIVWSQKDIARFGGISAVEGLRTKGLGRGYANGGIVGNAPTIPSFPKSKSQQVNSEPINIHVVVNTEDGTVETNANEISAKLKRDVEVIVDRQMAKNQRPGGGLR